MCSPKILSQLEVILSAEKFKLIFMDEPKKEDLQGFNIVLMRFAFTKATRTTTSYRNVMDVIESGQMEKNLISYATMNLEYLLGITSAGNMLQTVEQPFHEVRPICNFPQPSWVEKLALMNKAQVSEKRDDR